jgi:hypothetical protein
MRVLISLIVCLILLLSACSPVQQTQSLPPTILETPVVISPEPPIRQETLTPPIEAITTPTLTLTPTPSILVSATLTPAIEPSGTETTGGGAIVIDHTSIEQFDRIPDPYIAAASSIRLMVRGASVEDNINNGLDCLWGNFPGRRPSRCFDSYNSKYDRSNWAFQFRANPGWIDKVTDFITSTEQQIQDFDAFTFAFGYVDGQDNSNYPSISDTDNFQKLYISKLEALEAEHPDKTFIMWTMSLARVGFENTQNFNNMVRQYALKNHKLLLDIADIEAHDPQGNEITDEQGHQIIFQGYTNEEQAGHLNRDGQERMSKAVWVLMAMVAGWRE